MRFFVTGSAGFIGFHLARRLLEDGHKVLGLDGMTPYYDPALKRWRNAILAGHENYSFVEAMLADRETLGQVYETFAPDVVVHLAAQAGVRYSLVAPETYIAFNIEGTFNLLEGMKHRPPRHFLFASSSSIYGGNEDAIFSETSRTDFPASLYAATKKTGELLTHSHAHLHAIPTTCFRFFTVYGPAARPDMALYKFVEHIENDQPIDVYGEGRMKRDATAVEDIVEAIIRLADVEPQIGRPVLADGVTDSLSPVAPWRVVNIGGGRPVPLMALINAIENALGRRANKIMLPMQPGDLISTVADPSLLRALTGFVPSTDIETVVDRFVGWYRAYRK